MYLSAMPLPTSETDSDGVNVEDVFSMNYIKAVFCFFNILAAVKTSNVSDQGTKFSYGNVEIMYICNCNVRTCKFVLANIYNHVSIIFETTASYTMIRNGICNYDHDCS
jgi:hypothetical protein